MIFFVSFEYCPAAEKNRDREYYFLLPRYIYTNNFYVSLEKSRVWESENLFLYYYFYYFSARNWGIKNYAVSSENS